MDIYEPTAFALSFFNKRMVKGGIIVIDDYGFLTCPGIKRAVDEFCITNKITQFNLLSGQCLLIFE